MRHRFVRAGWLMILALFALASHAVEPVETVETAPQRISLDWIFSDEGKSAASTPDRFWLDDGTALLYDKTPAKPVRTLESFNPENGKRKQRVNPGRALASLTELLEPEEPLEELDWPAAFDPQGRWAAYFHEDDLFLLDLDASRFLRLTETEAEEKSARFSPDGSRLIFVRDNDMYLFDLEQKKETRLTEDGSATLLNGTVSWVYWEEVFGRNDLGYVWSPDSKSVAFLQTDESGVGLASFVDFKPNLPRVVQQRYPKTGEANPRVRAGVLDLESGKTTWVDLGAYHYESLVRLKWLPDGKRLAVQTLDRPQTTLDLFLVDGTSGAVSHLLRETNEGWINLHDDLLFLKDGKRFVWSSERDGFAHLYLYGIDGTLIRQITRGAWAVRSSGGVFWLSQAVAQIDEDNQWVYFTAQEKSSIEKHLYRIGLDGSGMQRLSKQDGSHKILFRPDGQYYFDESSSIERTPSLTLHRPDGRSVAAVAPSRMKPFEELDLLPRELLTISTRDGFEMPSMLLRPRDFDPNKKYPVVIYVYGGPSAPTVAHRWGSRARDYFEQILANRGYLVLRVDNRSATAISKTLENRIVLEGYGETELADLLDAVKWLKSRSFVDPQRVGIWGWSGGGSFTLLAMTASEEFRAGIAVAAVSDWRYYDTKWAEAFMKRPQDNPEGYAKTSHAERAKDLHGRLLLVHGTHDDNVHPQNAWRFTDELIDAGITFDMMIYPMRTHGIRDDEAQRHLYNTMLEFWDRNLK